ncbi:MAG TPA: hypothetical protein PKO41_08760 [Dokdonella sp.]|uniref:hypothetical protein n=1 Tax=Dokdonella sp. TaxID=2291710 RepID=UPI0025BECBEF|nr:hypothetical protein [Dokdonella sp.]MBX3691820.1 hypothetical protein [Dokdonella sp.]MCW5568342.1 hypothetical protein [Dokdonella sp.]HNR92502.1 hypothetical protein [Dokdonella sp.]
MIRTSLLACTLTLTLAFGAALPAAAAVKEPDHIRQLHTSPTVGQYKIAAVRGPGVFVGASVVGLGIDATQTTAYVAIDGRVIMLGSLNAADAAFGGNVNSGVGVAYAKDLGGRARASFGFAEPLRFERELHVYVRVDAGTPMAVFGDVVWGADAD